MLILRSCGEHDACGDWRASLFASRARTGCNNPTPCTHCGWRDAQAHSALQVKTARWADLTDDESSESEEDSDEAVEEPLTQEQLEQGIASGMVTGLASSLEGGIDTDATLELRKAGGTSTAGATPALFTVLEQQQAGPQEGLAAVGHTYRLPDAPKTTSAAAAKKRCSPPPTRCMSALQPTTYQSAVACT